MSKLDNRINKVGANTAALAALHPLDFDPDSKLDVAVGYGHYKNANATAIGTFYRPNEDTMISLGASLGGEKTQSMLGSVLRLVEETMSMVLRLLWQKRLKISRLK